MIRRGNRIGGRVLVTLVAVAALLVMAAAPAQGAIDRYSISKGWYALQSSATGTFIRQTGLGYDVVATSPGAAESFRMQATTLGQYLLYGEDRDFLATGLLGSVRSAANPSAATEWKVVAASGAFELRNVATNRPLRRTAGGGLALGSAGQSDGSTRFGFVATGGCPAYPEVELNATGTPAGGDAPYAEATGLADMHNHVSAFEFLGGRAHCGRPWSPYGAPDALVDCPDHYPNGSAAILENLFYGNPLRTHDPVGWPTFADWPAYDSLTHEQTYYRWIERAWMGGERLMVNNLVENGVLCRLYPFKKNSCNEMDAVRLQAKRMYQLQDYIDAQEGGPGKGWFRIVTNPFEARRVINDGKLAVVLGIEESELFGCTEYLDRPQCTLDDIDRGIKEVKDLGVSSFYPIHKFDNAFGGTRFDGGAVGTVINGGQFLLSGHFWQVGACPGEEADNTITGVPADAAGGDIIAGGLAAFLPPISAPVYPPGPHCNVRGLTALGRKLIDRMIDNHLLVEVDHMSVKARDATLQILADRGYSGVLSGHEWSDKHNYKQILALGGMVGGRADNVENVADDWATYRQVRSPDYFFGWGFGPDANGLGSLPSPSEDAHPVTYPFTSYRGDVTLDRQVSGQRTFDVNTDGTAHYGLIPDWVEDLRLDAGDAIARDMFRGSEAYLETWERAYGVAPESCRPAGSAIRRNGSGPLVLGTDAFDLLREAGQPALRTGTDYRYCLQGERGGTMLAAFDDDGEVALVAGNGSRQSVSGVQIGQRRSGLEGNARKLAHGLLVRRAPGKGGSVFVYALRRHRVAAAGVATAAAAHSPAELQRAMKPLR
jgi:hypothetical protein